MANLGQLSLFFEALLEELPGEGPPEEEPLKERPPEPELPYQSPEPEPFTSLDGSEVDSDVADAVQRKAALDIHRSWIVEAPAGSGKTGLLIQRFLKLLAYGGADQPDEILAITFTRKAGAEMRHRVITQLTAAHAKTPLSEDAGPFERSTRQLAEAALARDRASGWGLLTNPRRLNIRTIDSFCAELAASLPLTAGAGGRYTPTNDPDPLYRLAAERTLLHMGGEDAILTGDLETLLLHRDAQPADFIALLADMLRQREQWGELVLLSTQKLSDEELDQQVRPRLTHTLERLISRELEQVARLIGPDLLHRLATLAHTLSTCLAYNVDVSPIARCNGWVKAPTPAAQDLPHWQCLTHLLVTKTGEWRSGFAKNTLQFEVSKYERQQLQDLVEAFAARETQYPELRSKLCAVKELPDPAYPEDQWRNVKALCRTLRHALLELQLVFAERQSCDFSEIALNARSLLRSDTSGNDLLNTSIGRLKHLLVDEMQDTSANQYDLLEMLTSTWDGYTQTLFLVGDPKQSIYEFRQARVERFRNVMTERRLGHLTVSPLYLTANFRSQAALVDDFNTTFAQLFPSPDDPTLTADSVDVPFIAATPVRSAGGEAPLHWHFNLEAASRVHRDSPGETPLSPGEDNPDEPADTSTQIREIIETYLRDWSASSRGRAPRVAVLARSRSHLAPLIQEFHQNRGNGPLKFRAVEIEALKERQEILDLLALTRALLHPADRVAWLSVLRSPMCGLALDDLLTLTGDGAEADLDATVPHLIATRSDQLSPHGQLLLARSWPVLHQSLQTLGRTPLSTHLERTWRSLGGDSPLQGHERANARRFLDLLCTLETEPEPVTLSLLNRRLQHLYAEPNAQDASVELMTIHKAKGLEWDLVVIPALHRGSGTSGHEFLKWLEFTSADGDQEFLLAPIHGKGEASHRLSTWLSKRQAQRRLAEAKRLVYVACTRAREQLHLFATVTRKSDGSFQAPRRADSLLAAAWPAAERVLLAQQSALRDSAPAPSNVVVFPTTHSENAPLALAAAAEDLALPSKSSSPSPGQGENRPRYLPLNYSPLARFETKGHSVFSYPAPEALPSAAPFARPEGRFTTRAFGNAVHRFLQLLSMRLASGLSVTQLLDELPSWQNRLQATLRSEGLAVPQAAAEARRALLALQTALSDPHGAWVLSPHMHARDEVSFPRTSTPDASVLRADRTFFAPARPGETGEPTHLWIVDYKTAELGGRSPDLFLAEQRSRYGPQLEAYARAAIAAGQDAECLRLALYFPLLPSLLSWPFQLR